MPAWALVIFEFCDWKDRCNLMMTSRRWWRNTSSQSFYRFLAQRLAIECAVYVPPLPPANETWKSLFMELYKLRNIWKPHALTAAAAAPADPTSAEGGSREGSGSRFKISVYARFKPQKSDDAAKAGAADGAAGEEQAKQVSLPLHQRLAMIRMSRNLKSNRAALKVLTSEGGWFEAKWSDLSRSEAARLALRGRGGEDEDTTAPVAASAEAAAAAAAAAAANGHNSDKENSATINGCGDHRQAVAFDAGQKIPSFVRDLCVASDGASVGIRGKMRQQQQQHQSKRHGHVDDTPGMGSNIVVGVQNIDAMMSRVVMVAPDVGLREFAYDGVLPTNASQRSLYDTTARRLVMDFMNGFNSTAIVYGQTGSGKTYSMFGSEGPGAGGLHRHREGRGIVPRACDEIFRAVQQRRREAGVEATVSVSYVEIFGDEVSDLLRFGARCGHSKVASQRFVLQGAAEKVVHSTEELQELLRIGDAQKRRASTAMNERSTRAHSLFIVTLNQSLPNRTDVTLRSRLFLADLGGSEQVKKSQVEAGYTREGQTAEFSLGFEMADNMREAVYINLGLLALKKCIEALNNRALYVPYKDSKLTMLLSEGLGGNSKTSVIVCANTDAAHAAETMATLRFGERCAMIEMAVRNNATMLAGVLRALDDQIAALERAILEKERWEVRNEERKDELAEEGTFEKAMGAKEVKKVYILVGAEQERQQLEKLLRQRAKFIGSEPMEEDDSAKRGGVVGFGKEYAELYGLGEKFDWNAEFSAQNSRFEGKLADAAAVPKAIRARRNVKAGWATGESMETEKQEVLERRAQKAKRNKLAYSGISA